MDNIDMKSVLLAILEVQRRQAQTVRELYVEIQNVCEYLKAKDGEKFEKDFDALRKVAEFEMSVHPTIPILTEIENITSKLNGFKPVQLGDFEHLTAEEKDHMIETFTILVLGHRKE